MGCSSGRAVQVAPTFDNIIALQDDLEAQLAAHMHVAGAHESDQGDTAIPRCSTQPADTMIIFDWDDTLFPTAWVMRHDVEKGRVRHPGVQYEQDLERLTSAVVELLTQAKSFGEVVIVTNSTRGWVHHCCATIMPQATAILKHIPIFYGRELINAREQARMSQEALFKEAKVRAMRCAISCFYSGQPWKNVLSIGDASYEREARTSANHIRGVLYVLILNGSMAGGGCAIEQNGAVPRQIFEIAQEA